MTPSRWILAATLALATAALTLAPPAEAMLNSNGLNPNGLSSNGVEVNGVRPNGTTERGFGAGATVDANGLHLVTFTLPDGRALPAASRWPRPLPTIDRILRQSVAATPD